MKSMQMIMWNAKERDQQRANTLYRMSVGPTAKKSKARHLKESCFVNVHSQGACQPMPHAYRWGYEFIPDGVLPKILHIQGRQQPHTVPLPL
jgi:hypothetical protein